MIQSLVASPYVTFSAASTVPTPAKMSSVEMDAARITITAVTVSAVLTLHPGCAAGTGGNVIRVEIVALMGIV